MALGEENNLTNRTVQLYKTRKWCKPSNQNS